MMIRLMMREGHVTASSSTIDHPTLSSSSSTSLQSNPKIVVNRRIRRIEMEAASSSFSLVPRRRPPRPPKRYHPTATHILDISGGQRRGSAHTARIDALGGDGAPVEITWQIAVGSLAGIAPFLVAGIEFGKRIVAQKRCETCGGSGLVLKNDYYVRCPDCGGFLPWQSWKRFFTG